MEKTGPKPCIANALLFLIASALQASVCSAQNIPVHAQGLKEEFISVDLSDNKKQAGVYSVRSGNDQPDRLAVLLPGSPSVVRPVVENSVMTGSRLTGNFLIRARRFLADGAIATLVVDCHSESGDTCSGTYQASRERQQDVDKLIGEVKKRVPSIEQVWLVGTSLGTISSAFMPVYDPSAYAGAIHTATITGPYGRNSSRELIGFDYKKSAKPQFFIHHKDDPCAVTTYGGAKSISEKYNAPLITVEGGSGFQGAPCEAYSEHGFRGKEKEVMNAVAAIIKTGAASQLTIK